DASVMRFFELDMAQAHMVVSIEYQAARLDIEQTKNKKTRAEHEREFSDWENDNCSAFLLRDKEALVNEIHRIQR
ncbi:hypothetical protein, partial [Bifidobacterium animalis]|uniref:hypothetical protein n=1 Tax=Bifidobacterium animalis TaxID=28025 RepID=UPI0020BE1BAD